VFFSNRALVYLKLGRYYESITDATTSIERKPSIKAYARRAAAWASLKEHLLAVDDYKHALEFEPKNLECLQEFHRCLACLEQEFKAKLQSNPQNEKWREAIRHTVEEKKQVDMRIQAVQKSNVCEEP
jgi:tetratricopeptide (TPR) repeat protein